MGDIRFERLFNQNERAVIVAMDHCLFNGPQEGMHNLAETASRIAPCVDGILLSPAMLPFCRHAFNYKGAPMAVARLNWSTTYCTNWDYHEGATVAAFTPAEALRLGADVVLVRSPWKREVRPTTPTMWRYSGSSAARQSNWACPWWGVLSGGRRRNDAGTAARKCVHGGEDYRGVGGGPGQDLLHLGFSHGYRELSGSRPGVGRRGCPRRGTRCSWPRTKLRLERGAWCLGGMPFRSPTRPPSRRPCVTS